MRHYTILRGLAPRWCSPSPTEKTNERRWARQAQLDEEAQLSAAYPSWWFGGTPLRVGAAFRAGLVTGPAARRPPNGQSGAVDADTTSRRYSHGDAARAHEEGASALDRRNDLVRTRSLPPDGRSSASDVGALSVDSPLWVHGSSGSSLR